jgi:hypothetical protein
LGYDTNINGNVIIYDMLNKHKCLFSKMEDRKVKRSCLQVGASREGRI